MATEEPLCKACEHAPVQHDDEQCPRGQFVPPEGWTYEGPANPMIDGRPKCEHKLRIFERIQTSYTAICEYCNAVFVLRQREKPEHDEPKYEDKTGQCQEPV